MRDRNGMLHGLILRVRAFAIVVAPNIVTKVAAFVQLIFALHNAKSARLSFACRRLSYGLSEFVLQAIVRRRRTAAADCSLGRADRARRL
jgi:hypothetical protein